MASVGVRPRASAVVAIPATLRAVLRRVRTDWPQLVPVALAVFAAALVLAAIPRWLNRMSDDGIRSVLTDAIQPVSGISVTYQGRVAPSSSTPLTEILAENESAFRAGLAPSLQTVLDDGTFVAEGPNLLLVDETGAPLYESQLVFARLRFRLDDGIEQHTRIVEGRLPANAEPAVGPEDELIPVLEVALNAETARQLRLELNERVLVMPDPSDALAGEAPRSLISVFAWIELVGIFEINDPQDRYWFNDSALDRPGITLEGESVHIFAAGMFTAEQYDVLYPFTSQIDWRYRYRYRMNPPEVHAGMLDTIAGDVRRMETTLEPSSAITDDQEHVTISTGLGRLIDSFLRQRRLSVAMLAFTAIGFLALAGALIGLLAALVADRRRAATALLRGRGASAGQLVPAQLIEGLVIAVPAALAGWFAGAQLVDARASGWSGRAAIAVVVVAVLALLIAALPDIRRSLLRLERGTRAVERQSPRRLLYEVAVVAVALAGLFLLRRRGLSTNSSTREDLSFDPWLAAVPVLLGVATGILVLRLYPLPVRLLARIAGLRRGLVAFIGLRRSAERSPAERLPLLVLVLAVGISVFAAVIERSIHVGQEVAAWQRAGADYRVESTVGEGALPEELDFAAIPGVEAIALGYVSTGAHVDVGSIRTPFTLVAVPPRDLATVSGDTPAALHLPSEFSDTSVTGRENAPIPLLATDRWLDVYSHEIGEMPIVQVAGQRIVTVVVGTIDALPGIDEDQFVLVSYDHLSAAAEARDDPPPRPSVAWLRASPDAESDIRAAVEQAWQNGTVVSRSAELARVSDNPLIDGVTAAFQGSVVLAAVFAVMAVVAALVISARSRSYELSLMRTIGLSPRQALMAAVVEQVPAVIVAGAAGIALGIGIAWAAEPGLDLTAFTGAETSGTLHVDLVVLGAIAGGLAVTTLLAVILFSLVTRRVQLGHVLRVGDA